MSIRGLYALTFWCANWILFSKCTSSQRIHKNATKYDSSHSVGVLVAELHNIPYALHAGSTDWLRFSFVSGKRKKSRKPRSPTCRA